MSGRSRGGRAEASARLVPGQVDQQSGQITVAVPDGQIRRETDA
jgi:hypothetical protein